MEEEDDDFYAPAEPTAVEAHRSAPNQNATPAAPKDDGELEEGEEEEEESSESDIDIITERKDVEYAPPPHRPSAALKPEPPRPASTEPRAKSSAHAAAKPASTAPAAPGKPGSSYPEVRTSSIDVHASPIYPPSNKPLMSLDIDADLAEHDKPWRLPGADQSDYFNYGFDEWTWAMYCSKHQSMREELKEFQGNVDALEASLGMGLLPGRAKAVDGTATNAAASQPGVPGAPTGPAAQSNASASAGAGSSSGGAAGGQTGMGMGMPGMPGMPGMTEEMMQQMMAQMMASGMDVSQLDFNTFMQQFQQMAGGGGGGGGGTGGMTQPSNVPSGPAAQNQGFGGQQGQYGGYQQGGGFGGNRGGRGGRRW